MPKILLFFKQALESWLQFQFNPPERTEQIVQQILWLNSNIVIDKKTVFIEEMFKKGIIFVNDIINRTGGVMSHMQLTQTYGNVCSTQNYNQLIAALPQKWKRQVEGDKSKELACRPYIKEHKWLKKSVINKNIYQFHLRTKKLTAVPYKLQNSWEEIFDVPIPWHMVYELIRKTTPDSKLRIFQFKLLYKIPATNRMLYIWGIQSSQLCRFCCEEAESLDHLFWYCPHVARFWSQFQEWLKNCNICVELTLQIAILGDLKSHSQSINNIIIILAKMFIFNLQSVEAMRIGRFKSFVKHHSTVEKYMANKNPKWMMLEDRWERLSGAEGWD